MFSKLAKKHVEKYKARREEKRDPTVAERNAHYSPLRIYLHSTLKVFSADWVLMEGQNPDFILPEGDLDVYAIGKMPFDQDSTAWRIYVTDANDEEFIVNLLESHNKVDDIILLKQTNTIVPSTQAQLDRFTTQIGFQTLETDSGLVYDREWGDQWTEKLEFHEQEYDEHYVAEDEVVDYINQYILYSRKLDTGEKEWLFVGLEEGENFGELAFQIGYTVNLADVEVQ